jgi:myosin-1
MFVNSMNEMVEILNSKVPSYVRCIKPNHQKASHKIDDELFRHQIKYLGLEENVRVRRAGFCFRETYTDFFWRYRMLSKTTYPSWKGTEKEGTEQVLKDLAINAAGYQMGKTKLFIKSPKDVFRLEEERDVMMDTIANKLQNSWRSYLVYGARFPTKMYTRGCRWLARLLA